MFFVKFDLSTVSTEFSTTTCGDFGKLPIIPTCQIKGAALMKCARNITKNMQRCTLQTIVPMPILVYCTKTTLPCCAKRTTRKANLNKSLVIIRLAIGNKKVYNDKRNRRKEKASGGQTVCRVAMQQKEEEK